MKIFGFELKRIDDGVPDQDHLPSIIPPANDDGAAVVMAGGTQSFILDLDGSVRTEAELIARYRDISLHPEVETALDDIVNEAIVVDQDTPPVTLDLSDLELPDNLKQLIQEEFERLLGLLEFNTRAYEIFKQWYVDGRIYYNVIIDEENPEEGIAALRNVNALYLKKVREELRVPDEDGFNTVAVMNEYYVYQEGGFKNGQVTANFSMTQNQLNSIKIAKDSIVYVTSGLQDPAGTIVLSHLHSAIKPINQLRMLEDAAIIFRLVRAPSRRVFKVDVGGLPRGKAEEYVNAMMRKHKNKVVYDQTTGEVRDERKFMTMLEDYWFPNQNGKGTEVDILQGGENFGQMDDIMYFKQQVYEALKIPFSRTNPSEGFSLGRPSEITRDEVKFSKYVTRLRLQFSQLFYKILSTQLMLRQIVSQQEWDEVIYPKLRFKFTEDNFFEELKQSEILKDRLQTMQMVTMLVPDWLSRMWVWKNVMRLSEDQVKEIMQENAMDAQWIQMRMEMMANEEIAPLLTPSQELQEHFLKNNNEES